MRNESLRNFSNSAVSLQSLLFFYSSCNSYVKPSTAVKILLIGSDSLLGWSLRPYVELLSSKPQDWLSYSRIYIVPFGMCSISRQLAALDAGYSGLFPADQDIKLDDLALRIQRYISVPSTAPVAQLPIAEVMLNCYDDSSQQFVPFINVCYKIVCLFRLIIFIVCY